MTSASRRHILLSMAGLATSAALPGRAWSQEPAAFDPAALTWDEARAGALWRRTPPGFVVIDNYAMRFEAKTRPAPATRLTPAQIKEVKEALQAASAYFKRRGMGPPDLPMANDAFHVFFVTNMGEVNGASGEGRGSIPLAEFDPDFLNAAASVMGMVPHGSHMMLNAVNYFSPSPKHPWAPRTTLAHELLHTIDRYMVPGDAWSSHRPDGIGKWWSEGNIEAVAPFALHDLGYRPLTLWKAGERDHAQNIGMRPYDYPLTLKGCPGRVPAWVKNGAEASKVNWVVALFADKPTEAEIAESFFSNNATYFSSSFWRFLLQEEAPFRPIGETGRMPLPGDFELLGKLRRHPITAADRKAAAGNPHMDAGIPALDRFLRGHHPTWGASGLHRAFPAFIAHWVEWPDQVVRSRKGMLDHQIWMDAMFMDGARIHDLTEDKDITVELTVLPLAAKAIRFELPSVALVDQIYPAVTITVSILDDGGQAKAVDNIHVGLRGQCLGNGNSQPSRYGRGRVRRWAGVKATPLLRANVDNLTTLSFINVAPDPASTRPVRIRVNVALQVARSLGQCSYHPLPIELPDAPPKHVPSSQAPRGEETVPLVPAEIGAEEIKVVLIKDADLVRILNASLDSSQGVAMPRESDEGPADRQGMAAQVMAGMAGGGFTPGSGMGGIDPRGIGATMKRALRVELTIPTFPAGYVGAVAGAQVTAEWHEPAYAAFAEYGVSTSVQIETDAVQVQITSSGDGAILGTFSADFDRGSQNVDSIFRGRIEGRFSLGIANDEPSGDQQLPEDPSACLPTDFFISAARAGMDTAQMGEAIREQAGALSAGGSSGAGEGAGTAGGGVGQAGVLDPAACRIDRTEDVFDRWFKKYYDSQTAFQPADLAEMRRQLWENWDVTEKLICDGMMPL